MGSEDEQHPQLVQKKADAIRQPNSGSLRAVVYSDILDGWLRASKLKTKESTHAHYSQLVRTHIKPHLGRYQLSRISTSKIEGFLEYLLSKGRLDGAGGLSPKTVTDILAIIKNTMGILIGVGVGLLEQFAKAAWLKVIRGEFEGKEYLVFAGTTSIGNNGKKHHCSVQG